MGIGNSQTSQRHQSSGHGTSNGKKQKKRFFRRNKSSPTRDFNLPSVIQPASYQRLFGTRRGTRPIPIYPPLEQPSPSFLPISYNNFRVSSYMPPQPMMMLPPRVTPFMPASYMAPAPSPQPPISIPYIQQPQIQPIYNNMAAAPTSMPMGISAGAILNPPLYPGAPARFITDWTGGGAISPGFLGPPI
ncbi:unnamed protein product [Rotaria sordida]|uniref:Uncharacterized protein n=1 Tax=Rotaria sordida TaxID=392033 RepID=A0A815V5Q2_9BILA|nr:unnamed protein product [Rotaria sordida]CAF1525686.1 unnamed protein product [Rotaria sordida]